MTYKFDLRGVVVLVKHALMSVRHRAAYMDGLEETDPKPALWLVLEQRTYLMSNGIPPMVENGVERVVYCDGGLGGQTPPPVGDYLELLPVEELKEILVKEERKDKSLFCVDVEGDELNIYLR